MRAVLTLLLLGWAALLAAQQPDGAGAAPTPVPMAAAGPLNDPNLPPPALDAASPQSPDAPAAEPAGDHAVEPADEPVIPIAFDAGRYAGAWDNNPFTRKVAAMAQPVVNWAQDWVLLSMYNNRGKVRVSIRNRQTNEIKRLGDDSNEQEFKLVKANFHRSRREASAEVAHGSENATIKFDENLAPLTINNVAAAAANAANNKLAPGNPQQQAAIQQQAMQAQQAAAARAAAQGQVNPALQRPAGAMQGQPQQPMPMGMLPPGAQSSDPSSMAPSTVPPPISRRRQLIPAPIINPPANP